MHRPRSTGALSGPRRLPSSRSPAIAKDHGTATAATGIKHKSELMDREYRTYSERGNRMVCPDCVSDSHLGDAIRRELGDEQCSYCGGDQAAPLAVLLNVIEGAIMFRFADPAEELPYDSGEGGYQGEVLEGYEVVDELGDWTDCDELREDVAYAFADTAWCKRDYFGLDDYQCLRFGWERFSEQVKHTTRYLFLYELETDDHDPRNIAPGRMLDELGTLFCEFGLFRVLPAGTEFVRARVVEAGERPATAAALGTAERDKARLPNRMSPAGIPMFYGALDEDTAVLETYDPGKAGARAIALARFRSGKPLYVLDLTALPPLPSEFDADNRGKRYAISFLRDFERDLTRPVERDERVHIEYVPTQVVTEYVRHRLRGPRGPVDGILYRSSRDLDRRRTAVVIFAEHRDCGPRHRDWYEPEPFLELGAVRYADPAEFAPLWASSALRSRPCPR